MIFPDEVSWLEEVSHDQVYLNQVTLYFCLFLMDDLFYFLFNI